MRVPAARAHRSSPAAGRTGGGGHRGVPGQGQGPACCRRFFLLKICSQQEAPGEGPRRGASPAPPRRGRTGLHAAPRLRLRGPGAEGARAGFRTVCLPSSPAPPPSHCLERGPALWGRGGPPQPDRPPFPYLIDKLTNSSREDLWGCRSVLAPAPAPPTPPLPHLHQGEAGAGARVGVGGWEGWRRRPLPFQAPQSLLRVALVCPQGQWLGPWPPQGGQSLMRFASGPSPRGTLARLPSGLGSGDPPALTLGSPWPGAVSRSQNPGPSRPADGSGKPVLGFGVAGPSLPRLPRLPAVGRSPQFLSPGLGHFLRGLRPRCGKAG